MTVSIKAMCLMLSNNILFFLHIYSIYLYRTLQCWSYQTYRYYYRQYYGTDEDLRFLNLDF